jgi:hypothetical protein
MRGLGSVRGEDEILEVAGDAVGAEALEHCC